MGKFIKAIFSDGEWDGDATKFVGFIIVGCGLGGFIGGVSGFEFVLAFGAGLIATGKFSKQG